MRRGGGAGLRYANGEGTREYDMYKYMSRVRVWGVGGGKMRIRVSVEGKRVIFERM